jgi:hypothetical protein
MKRRREDSGEKATEAVIYICTRGFYYVHYLLRSIGNIHHWVRELSEFNETFQNSDQGKGRERERERKGAGYKGLNCVTLAVFLQLARVRCAPRNETREAMHNAYIYI